MGQIIEMRRRYGSGVLPYDRRVEWLGTTGTQYIVIPFNNMYSIHIEFSFGNIYKQQRIYSDEAKKQELYVNYRNYLSCSRNAEHFEFAPIRTDIRYTADYDADLRRYSFSNTGRTLTFNSNGNDASKIFVCCQSPGSNPFNGKIYSFRYMNQYKDKTIMDLIPVRVGNVGYMYDKVSRQLFGNAGTGSFVVGPDVVGGSNSL